MFSTFKLKLEPPTFKKFLADFLENKIKDVNLVKTFKEFYLHNKFKENFYDIIANSSHTTKYKGISDLQPKKLFDINYDNRLFNLNHPTQIDREYIIKDILPDSPVKYSASFQTFQNQSHNQWGLATGIVAKQNLNKYSDFKEVKFFDYLYPHEETRIQSLTEHKTPIRYISNAFSRPLIFKQYIFDNAQTLNITAPGLEITENNVNNLENTTPVKLLKLDDQFSDDQMLEIKIENIDLTQTIPQLDEIELNSRTVYIQNPIITKEVDGAVEINKSDKSLLENYDLSELDQNFNKSFDFHLSQRLLDTDAQMFYRGSPRFKIPKFIFEDENFVKEIANSAPLVNYYDSISDQSYAAKQTIKTQEEFIANEIKSAFLQFIEISFKNFINHSVIDNDWLSFDQNRLIFNHEMNVLYNQKENDIFAEINPILNSAVTEYYITGKTFSALSYKPKIKISSIDNWIKNTKNVDKFNSGKEKMGLMNKIVAIEDENDRDDNNDDHDNSFFK